MLRVTQWTAERKPRRCQSLALENALAALGTRELCMKHVYCWWESNNLTRVMPDKTVGYSVWPRHIVTGYVECRVHPYAGDEFSFIPMVGDEDRGWDSHRVRQDPWLDDQASFLPSISRSWILSAAILRRKREKFLGPQYFLTRGSKPGRSDDALMV